MNNPVSPSDDALARDIIAKNGYAQFVANKKLMLAWLVHAPVGTKPLDVCQDEWLPFLFFVRRSCCLTMFDVAFDWLGLDAFDRMARGLIDAGEIYEHEMLYMTKNDMIRLAD